MPIKKINKAPFACAQPNTHDLPAPAPSRRSRVRLGWAWHVRAQRGQASAVARLDVRSPQLGVVPVIINGRTKRSERMTKN